MAPETVTAFPDAQNVLREARVTFDGSNAKIGNMHFCHEQNLDKVMIGLNVRNRIAKLANSVHDKITGWWRVRLPGACSNTQRWRLA